MFDKVKGQKKAMEQLEADLASGRLAESYLFAGPEGSRMREAAMEFAKAVNCLNVRRQSLIPDNEIAKLPCGECSSCKKADSGNHPEIFILDFITQAEMLALDEEKKSKQKEYKIDAVRMILDRAHLSSFEAKKKIVIVDGAEDLSEEAGNAFLKALEEAPRQCLWILLSQSPERVLATIRSRCRKISFSPKSLETAAEKPIHEAGERLAEEFLAGGRNFASTFEMSSRVLALEKKQGNRKSAELFLKLLAGKLAEDLRSNPSPRKADDLLSVLEAEHHLGRNVSPQMVLDALLPSIQ